MATHDYDKADRLLSITNAKDATPISSYLYSGIHPATGLPVSYDANGNRLIQVETNGGTTETTTYGYDDLDRLATVTYPIDTAYPQGRVVSYGYDAVGNRIRETEKDSADVVLADKQGLFDNPNRLTELTDLVAPANSTTFTWDPNGNQTSARPTARRHHREPSTTSATSSSRSSQGASDPRPLPVRLRRPPHQEDRRRGPPPVRLRPDVAAGRVRRGRLAEGQVRLRLRSPHLA